MIISYVLVNIGKDDIFYYCNTSNYYRFKKGYFLSLKNYYRLKVYNFNDNSINSLLLDEQKKLKLLNNLLFVPVEGYLNDNIFLTNSNIAFFDIKRSISEMLKNKLREILK